MERNLLFVLSVMLFCVCGCFSQNTIVQDGVVYTLRYSEKKNEVLVTGYQGSPSSVIIADSITFVKTKYPVTTLKYQAFKDCSTLMYVELPDCLTEIQGSVFDGCTKLSSIVIPENDTIIGDGAFRGCSSLKHITIPRNVQEVRSDAFRNCTSLSSVLFNATSCGVYSAFSGCPIKNFIFGEDVKYISGGCCENVKSLTSVVIPDAVEAIGDWAFAYCENLVSIEIPESIKWIGKNVFYGCTSLKTIYWNAIECSDLTSSWFWNAPVEQIIFGDGVKSIPSYCCYKMSGLVSIELPQSVSSIGNYAFSECTELISIEIPQGVSMIGDYAFSGCSKLSSIEIPQGLSSIGDYAFDGCTGISSIVLPQGVSYVGNYAFRRCSGLTSIEISDGLSTIGELGTFGACAGLTSVLIPGSINSICVNCFSGCTELTSITMLDGVEAIGGSAFYNCSKINSLTLPTSVLSVEKNTFQGMSSLDTLIISNPQAQIPYYSKALYNMSLKYFVAPANALAVKESDLSNTTSSIKTLVVNGGELNDECFAFINRQRKALTRLDMSGAENLSIADEAFLDSYKLEDVILPDNTVSIGYKSFSGCISLKSITIPKYVASIGYGAYSDCEDVEYIYCAAATPPTIKSNTFSNVRKDIPVYVPCESIELYNAAGGWSDFTNIQCIQEAEPVDDPIDEPVVDPDHTSVEITWPVSFDADKYVINVMLGGKIFCTLTFNEKGLLLSIEYPNGDPSSRSAELRAAIPTAGYKFTIKGLTEGTEYTYTVDAVNALGSVIEEYEGSFKTLGDIPTDVTEASANEAKVTGVYNLVGQPVPASISGPKIFTYSDGTVVKTAR